MVKWVNLWAVVVVLSVGTVGRVASGAAPSAASSAAEVECGGGAAGWAVRDASAGAGGAVCVLACLRAQAAVRYRRRDGSEAQALLALPAPPDAVATGECAPAPAPQRLHLSWLEGNASLELTWAPEPAPAPNVTAAPPAPPAPPAHYALRALTLTLSPAALPDAAWEESRAWEVQGDWWQVGGDAYWQCAPNDTFELQPAPAPAPTVPSANVTVWAVRAQAYRAANSTQWAPARAVRCGGGGGGGDVSDVVPLVVGALLAALVAFVLGAYLLARRRHAHTGYLSM